MTMYMKQLFTMGLALAILFSSCGKNDPIPTPHPPKPTPEQPQTKKPGEEKKPEDPKTPQKPEEPKKPDTPQPKKPKQPEAPKQTPRPQDVDMGLRSIAKWSVSEAKYLKDFNFEALYVDNKAEELNIQAFKDLISIEVVGFDGSTYTFTEEDLKHVTIQDVKFTGSDFTSGRITFRTVYKGVRSQIETSLPFDHKAFYRNKISTNLAKTGKRYLRGSAEYLSVFYNSLLNYDTDRYRIILKSSLGISVNESSNSITCHLSVEHIGTDKPLATILYEIEGFKTLSALKSELQIASTHELMTNMKDRFKRYSRNPQLFSKSVESTVKQWIKLADLSIDRGDSGVQTLSWEEVSAQGRGIFDVLKAGGEYYNLDASFESPQFIVKNVRWDDTDLLITVELQAIGEVAGLGIEKTIRVPKVKA